MPYPNRRGLSRVGVGGRAPHPNVAKNAPLGWGTPCRGGAGNSRFLGPEGPRNDKGARVVALFAVCTGGRRCIGPSTPRTIRKCEPSTSLRMTNRRENAALPPTLTSRRTLRWDGAPLRRNGASEQQIPSGLKALGMTIWCESLGRPTE